MKFAWLVLAILIIACTGCTCCNPEVEVCELGQDICEPTPIPESNPQWGTTLHNAELTLEEIGEIKTAQEAADRHNRSGRPNFPAKGGQ